MNAGQANAATGELGYADSLASAEAVATALGVSPDDVLLQSTGVIGRRIKMEALLDAVPKLAATLGSGAEDAHRAAVSGRAAGEPAVESSRRSAMLIM